MRVVSASIAALLVLTACQSLAQPADGDHQPRILDVPLPIAPAQGLPWKPSQPVGNEQSINRLFDWALADPRGLPYHNVVQQSLGCRAGRTRGWVLPPEPGTSQRFAIDWNGIIRPISTIGEAANVEADVKRLLGLAADNAPPDEVVPLIEWDHSSVAILYRLGHADLAWELERRRPIEQEFAIPPEVYIHREWSTRLMLAAETAHARGLDRLALGYLMRFDVTVKEMEAAIARDWGDPLDPDTVYFPRLNQLAALKADQLRRHARNRRSAMPVIWPADQQARIAALIEYLDEAHGESAGIRMEGVTFRRDNLITELVAEGEAAIPQLIEVVERDERLCRAAAGWMTQDHEPHIYSVRSPAYAAICQILRWYWDDSIRESVPEIKRFWSRYRAVPKHLRWYLILADDEAGESAWRQAASRITRSDPYFADRSNPLLGELLRGLTGPSVTELLIRRDLLDELVNWDPEAAVAVLQEATRKAMAGSSGMEVAKRLMQRMALGDATAFGEYAQWLLKYEPHQASHYIEPLVRFRDHPSMQKLADELMGRLPSDQMQKVLTAQTGFRLELEHLVELEPFRRVIVAGLQNESQVGEPALSDTRTKRVKDVFAVWVGRRLDMPDVDERAALEDRNRVAEEIRQKLLHFNPDPVPITSPPPPRIDRDIVFSISTKLETGLTLTLALVVPPQGKGPDVERQIWPMNTPLAFGVYLAAPDDAERQIPAALIQEDDAGRALSPGFTIHLQHAGVLHADPGEGWGPLTFLRAGPGDMFNDMAPWRDVPRRGPVPEVFQPMIVKLAAGDRHRAGRFDLHEWFVIERPGIYRIWLTLDDGSPLGKGESSQITFCLRPVDENGK